MGAQPLQAHESAVAEVGLMLRVSARTAAARVGDARSLDARRADALVDLVLEPTSSSHQDTPSIRQQATEQTGDSADSRDDAPPPNTTTLSDTGTPPDIGTAQDANAGEGRPRATVVRVGAPAVALGWTCGSPFPTPRYSAPTITPVS